MSYLKCQFCGERVTGYVNHLENQHDERALETGDQPEIGPEESE